MGVGTVGRVAEEKKLIEQFSQDQTVSLHPGAQQSEEGVC